MTGVQTCALPILCAADSFLAEHPATVEWWGGQFSSGQTPVDAEIVQTVRRVHGADTGRELAILEAALFDHTVRLLKDGKAFDIENAEDDKFLMECNMEADIIKGLNRKLDFARKMMEAET